MDSNERTYRLPGTNLRVTPKRWPWHVKTFSALLDFDGKPVGEKWGWLLDVGGTGRFGGGWLTKLGIEVSGKGFNLYLVWGYVNVRWDAPAGSK